MPSQATQGRGSQRCCAIVGNRRTYQQEWVKRCENAALFRGNGVPLCGTHVNHPPFQVIRQFYPEDIQSVEPLGETQSV